MSKHQKELVPLCPSLDARCLFTCPFEYKVFVKDVGRCGLTDKSVDLRRKRQVFKDRIPVEVNMEKKYKLFKEAADGYYTE